MSFPHKNQVLYRSKRQKEMEKEENIDFKSVA
jgi:hypothetical protein